MRKTLFLLVILLSFNTKAQQITIINARNKTYAGKTIILSQYTDYITKTTKEISRTTADSAGNFSFSFPLETTQRLTLELGAYRGFVFCQPGDSCEVILPDYKELSEKEKLALFFEPQEITLFSKDSTALTSQIFAFEILLNRFIDYSLYTRKTQKDTIDKYIAQIENFFADNDNEFFKQYRTYSYAMFKRLTYMMRQEKVLARQYFFDSPVLFNNPAYFALFNNLFENPLDSKDSFLDSRTAIYGLKNKNILQIADSLAQSNGIKNRQTAILIALKGVAELAFKYENVADDAIDALNYTYIRDKNLSIIQENLYKQLTQLRHGYPAPELIVQTGKRKKISLSKLKGKFVYLNFCNLSYPSCKRQLEMLKRYSSSNLKNFEIVTIVYGMNDKEFSQFSKKHKTGNWIILNGQKNMKLLEKYRVVTFPVYYLIGPDGRLLLSPAPSPEENFEFVFLRIYQNYNQKKSSDFSNLNY